MRLCGSTLVNYQNLTKWMLNKDKIKLQLTAINKFVQGF